MYRRFVLAVLFAAGVVLATASQAHATLQVRVTSYDSAGTQLGTITDTVAGASQVFNTAVPDFSVVIASNIANTGGGETSHSLTINIRYDGTGLGASSSLLLVEFAGFPYNTPIGPSTIVSNASPSTSGLAASFVEMVSAVTTGVIVLPPTANSPIALPAGLLGTTIGTGTMGSASSVLVPNPVTGSLFNAPANFTFYQRFTFDNFTTRNEVGSISAGSVVSNIPEPATMAIWSVIGGLGAVAGWRRRRTG